jgi:DNA-binding XRE family transcriptional regulator
LAKKPLKRPTLPPGDQTEFFDFLQRMVVRCGDLPISRLASTIDFSHQTVYKALTGPKMPSQRVLDAIVGALDRDSLPEARERWQRAVAEARSLPSVDVHKNPASALENSENSAQERLSSRLREAYEESPLKAEGLASKVGFSRSTAYNVISGRSLPAWEVMAPFVELLDLAPEEIHPLHLAARQERRDQQKVARRRRTLRQRQKKGQLAD